MRRNMTEKEIRKKYKGKANFRVVGSDRAGYKLVVKNTSDKVYKDLKKKENKLNDAFNTEIVNFV